MAPRWQSLRRDVQLPSGVDRARNGQLWPDEMRLVFLPGVGMGAAHPKAAQAWDSLALHFWLNRNIQLSCTSAPYRSLEEQEGLFLRRFTTDRNPENLAQPLIARTYQGQIYYLKRGQSLASTPRRSNHGLGIAFDASYWVILPTGRWGHANLSTDRESLTWLEDHAHEHGFFWNVSSEVWHLEYCTGDAVPELVDATMRILGRETV